MATIRTLVVDDTELVRRMLSFILRGSEFQVVGEAVDGEDAIVQFRALMPDLVLMDIIMPGTSGIEAVRRIRAENPEAMIVMCSAVGQEAIVQQALTAGASGFITKPFVADHVLQSLREAFARRSSLSSPLADDPAHGQPAQ